MTSWHCILRQAWWQTSLSGAPQKGATNLLKASCTPWLPSLEAVIIQSSSPFFVTEGKKFLLFLKARFWRRRMTETMAGTPAGEVSPVFVCKAGIKLGYISHGHGCLSLCLYCIFQVVFGPARTSKLQRSFLAFTLLSHRSYHIGPAGLNFKLNS